MTPTNYSRGLQIWLGQVFGVHTQEVQSLHSPFFFSPQNLFHRFSLATPCCVGNSSTILGVVSWKFLYKFYLPPPASIINVQTSCGSGGQRRQANSRRRRRQAKLQRRRSRALMPTTNLARRRRRMKLNTIVVLASAMALPMVIM